MWLERKSSLLPDPDFGLFSGPQYNREEKPNSTCCNVIDGVPRSNNRESLLRPVLFWLFCNGILFSIFNYLSGFRFLPVSDISYQPGIDISAKFIGYLNPFHKADDLTDWGLILDIFGRIVSSNSIYNIIRATRRFIK